MRRARGFGPSTAEWSTPVVTGPAVGYVTVIPAGIYDHERLLVAYQFFDLRYPVDIAVGDAGSEVSVFNTVPSFGFGQSGLLPVPVRIPAGVRVSVSSPNMTSSGPLPNLSVATTHVGVLRRKGESAGKYPAAISSTVNAFGLVTATSGNPGAWAQLWAAGVVTPPILVLALQTLSPYRLQFGYGAAGSEVAVGSPFVASQWNTAYAFIGLQEPVLIPAGQRVVIRYAEQTGSGSSATVYGVWWVDSSTPGQFQN